MKKGRVKGWILTYTLTLMTIAIIVIYTLLSIFGFQLQLVGDFWSNHKVELDNRSGVNLYLSSNEEFFSSLEYKHLKIEELEFSPMTLLKIQSVIGLDTNIQWAQMGSSFSKTAPVIILPKSIYPLKLAGKCAIKGNTLIPFGRIEKYTGLVSMNSFDLQGVLSKTNESTQIAPKPVNKRKNSTKSYIEHFENLPNYNSFNNPTSIFFSTNTINLVDSYSGNIIIESTQKVIIESSATLDLVVIKAPEIQILEGWVGRGNFIATKNLIIENQTIFNYPSSILIKFQNTPNSNVFEFPESSILNGSMQITGTLSNHTPIIRGKINGNLYSTIPISFSGTISGQLWASQFSLTTTSSSYTNLIKNVHLNDSFQKNDIPIPLQFKSNQKSFIQWLD